jgi:hypothetical protein
MVVGSSPTTGAGYFQRIAKAAVFWYHKIMKIKGFSPAAIILLVIVILAIGGGIYLWYSSTPATSGEIANWQTYRSDEYGFEFKYPPNWYFDIFGTIKSGGAITLTTLPRSAYDEGGVLPKGGAAINILKWPLASVEQTIQKDLIGVEIQSRDSIRVGGEKADRVFSKISFPGGTFQKEIGIYLIHNSVLYKIFFTYWEGDQKESQFLTTFNTFLSTFKFT